MRTSTSIDAEGSTISPKDESAQGLDFDGNKKIKFLPIKVAETFPNLLVYDARICSLTITKANFEGIDKLNLLYLHENRISTINSETFEDLIALEKFKLRE